MSQNKKLKVSYPVKERNNLIIEFFNYHGLKIEKLIGDENQPKIILSDFKSVSGFVKNKIYNFTTKQFGGEVIYSVNLAEKEKEDSVHLRKIIESSERKKVYRLKIYLSDMYYVKTENYVPYFSKIEARYYFDFAKAAETQTYLSQLHQISVDIV